MIEPRNKLTAALRSFAKVSFPVVRRSFGLLKLVPLLVSMAYVASLFAQFWQEAGRPVALEDQINSKSIHGAQMALCIACEVAVGTVATVVAGNWWKNGTNDVVARRFAFTPVDLLEVVSFDQYFEKTIGCYDDYKAKTVIIKKLREIKRVLYRDGVTRAAEASWYAVLRLVRDEASEIAERRRLVDQYSEVIDLSQALASIKTSNQALADRVVALAVSVEAERLAKLPRPDTVTLARIMQHDETEAIPELPEPAVTLLRAIRVDTDAVLKNRAADAPLDDETFAVAEVRRSYIREVLEIYAGFREIDAGAAQEYLMTALQSIQRGVAVRRLRDRGDIAVQSAANLLFLDDRFPTDAKN